MPSNKELMAEAKEIADKLGISVRTTGLKNEELVDLVSDLRAKERDAELDTQADTAPEPESAPEPEQPKKPAGYRVAAGKAITCLKGVLADGDEVKPKYFRGGEETLARLVKSGHVVKG